MLPIGHRTRRALSLRIALGRTLDEIRRWKQMTDHRRHQVNNDRARRQAKLQRESSELPSA
ncbi:DUF1289 domain-containing protein [Paraburkholderia sediminicola]|uniref:hypothetical protein n=1 Tax=Paraburkholderia TaxID=1822464 RepID=UPI0038B94B47